MKVESKSQAMLHDVASRIKELREISGYSIEEMAEKTDVTAEVYKSYETGMNDLPFTFIHKCAIEFGVDMTELLEGSSARLSAYVVTRAGQGQLTAREEGIEITNLAPRFRKKLGEPFHVKYSYSEELQNTPIHTTTHDGQEFDLIISGTLRVRVGDHEETLNVGDSIFYNSSTPHGMIAVNGEDCEFLAVVFAGEDSTEKSMVETFVAAKKPSGLIYERYVDVTEDETGALKAISFKDPDHFNFGFDIVDNLGTEKPDKLAMLHVDRNKVERRFTFGMMKKESARAANYLTSLGVKRGDKVMLVLRRNYQFWPIIIALHKLGAVPVPATDQLLEKDFVYRFNAVEISAVIATADSNVGEEIDKALASSPSVKVRVMCNGCRDGWHDFDTEYKLFRSIYERTPDAPCGDDPALMYFSSGTVGYPKAVLHSYKYALGHFITAKYWHCVDPEGIHFTISETGWGKAMWGKLYGQWMCEGAVFTYDFNRFDAHDILPLFAKYNITTFCAPPTMYRLFIKEDLSKYDLSSIRYAATAGEALNPEVFNQFKKATGLSIMEAFGQTETTLTIGNLVGMTPKIGSMGKPSPLYDVEIMNADGEVITESGVTGEIVINTQNGIPCGLFKGYVDSERTAEAWHDGFYHTGDTAWRDEDGYFWYVGRVDDLIKSSGYRIGPFEIESVIMELPYVLECGVSAEPDEIRGQVVKASIVLTKGTVGTDELKKEIQEYVKHRTAPYKYPRIVVFRDELPKTISGKIIHNQL
ncbi:MAG: AMP-binding protein [Oscillospiraceae bacterium]